MARAPKRPQGEHGGQPDAAFFTSAIIPRNGPGVKGSWRKCLCGVGNRLWKGRKGKGRKDGNRCVSAFLCLRQRNRLRPLKKSFFHDGTVQYIVEFAPNQYNKQWSRNAFSDFFSDFEASRCLGNIFESHLYYRMALSCHSLQAIVYINLDNMDIAIINHIVAQ